MFTHAANPSRGICIAVHEAINLQQTFPLFRGSEKGDAQTLRTRKRAKERNNDTIETLQVAVNIFFVYYISTEGNRPLCIQLKTTGW